jgi:hypothetical protein
MMRALEKHVCVLQLTAVFVAFSACASVDTERSSESPASTTAALETSPAEVAAATSASAARVHVVLAEMPSDLSNEIFGRRDWNGITLDDRSAPDLEAFAATHSDLEILSRPRVVVRNGGTVDLSNTYRVKYVKDYESSVAGPAQPIVDSIEVGISAQMSARWVAGSGTLDLDYDFERTTLEQPIAERSLTIPGSDQRVTIQLPVAMTRSASGSRRLTNGQTLVLDVSAVPSEHANERKTVALVSVDF